jgi:two-component system, cell cycle response regulator DivK
VTIEAPLILIGEDSVDLREAYVDWFTFKGFRVESAADGHQALSKARELSPQAIVMDVSLPGLDGLEVARRLRGDAHTRAIPLIAITGHGGDDFVARTVAAGFDCYLLKPCLPDRLLAEVRRLMALSGR